MAQNLVMKATIKDQIVKGLGRIETSLIKLDKQQQKTAKSAKSMGQTVKTAFAFSVMYRGISGVINQLKLGTEEIKKFDLTMRQISGITQTYGKDLQTLSLTTRKLGLNTEFATSEVAKAALEYTKMGYSVEQVNKMMPTTMDLVSASGADVTEVIATVGQALKSYRIEASEAERVTNVIQGTVSQTAINFTDFGESLKHIAPIAKTVGMSFEETSALIGSLGDIGIKGSLAGTALKNMITNISKPSVKATKVLKDLNVESDNLVGILQQMKKAGAGVKEYAEVFNLRALASATGLSETEALEGFIELFESLGRQDVKVKNVAEEIRKSLNAQLEMLKSNLQQIPVNIFEMSKTMFDGQSILQIMNEKLRDFNEWLQTNPEEIAKWVRVLKIAVDNVGFLVIQMAEITSLLVRFPAILVPVIAVFKLWGTEIGLTQLKMVSLKTSMLALKGNLAKMATAMVNPFTLALVAVTALYIGIVKYSDALAKRANTSNKFYGDMTNKGLKNRIAHYEKYLSIISEGSRKYQNAYNRAINKGLDRDRATMVARASANREMYNDMSRAAKDAGLTGGDVDQTVQGAKYHGNGKAIPQSIDFSQTVDFLQKQIQGLKLQMVEVSELELGPDLKTLDITKLLEDLFKNQKKLKDGTKNVKEEFLDLSKFVQRYKDIIAYNAEDKQLAVIDKYTRSLRMLKDRFAEIEQKHKSGKLSAKQYAQAYEEINKAYWELKGASLDKTIDISNKKMLEYTKISGMQVVSIRKAVAAHDALKESLVAQNVPLEMMTEILRENESEVRDSVQNTIDGSLTALKESLDIADIFTTVALDNLRLVHEEKMEMLADERDANVLVAGQNAQARIRAEQKYAKEKEKLDAKLASEEKKYLRQKKAWAISQVWIDTALAIANVWSTWAKVPPVAIALSATAAGMGIAQTVAISKQKFAQGTPAPSRMPIGNSGATTDMIDAKISPTEYIISGQETSALGGFYGVEQMISNALVGNSGSGQQQNFNFYGQVVGQPEYVRELMSQEVREDNRWSR